MLRTFQQYTSIFEADSQVEEEESGPFDPDKLEVYRSQLYVPKGPEFQITHVLQCVSERLAADQDPRSWPTSHDFVPDYREERIWPKTNTFPTFPRPTYVDCDRPKMQMSRETLLENIKMRRSNERARAKVREWEAREAQKKEPQATSLPTLELMQSDGLIAAIAAEQCIKEGRPLPVGVRIDPEILPRSFYYKDASTQTLSAELPAVDKDVATQTLSVELPRVNLAPIREPLKERPRGKKALTKTSESHQPRQTASVPLRRSLRISKSRGKRPPGRVKP